jgi:site-specific recombinase XerD
LKNYKFLFTRVSDTFSERELQSITPDKILSFLTRLAKGNNQTTKRNRYSSLKAVFNYIRNTIDFEVKKAGESAGVNRRPHDLRRHAATHASRSGTPIEIFSKVILRHAYLSTTQRYLGKITDVEAIRWIKNLYA